VAHERVLVVDDEPSVRTILRRFLEATGCDIQEAGDATEALALFRAAPPDIVLCDYQLRDGDGLTLLKQFKAIEPQTPVLILTGYGTIDLAVRAIKEGAEHFITKPVNLPALSVLLTRIVDQRRSERRHTARDAQHAGSAPDPFLGTSAAIRELAQAARRVAESDSTVLLQGETGAGKGVVARWLHEHGPRSHEAFVDLNCAGLGGELLESELFGYAKGAFTGAVAPKKGLLEVAHQGTLFLDEIADMDLGVQPKLLKVLEERRFRRLGDVAERMVDIRLIAATHQDLASLVRTKGFRQDLYFRVNTVPIEIPPLRNRTEDIPLLAKEILGGLAVELGRPGLELPDETARALQRYAWPGNIRELRNVLERAILLSDARLLKPSDLQFPSKSDSLTQGLGQFTLADLERRHIEQTLGEVAGHVANAAARLGIPRSSLYQKMKQLGITRSTPQNKV
jgi:DNA-binding NtrC family response regulator